jgi:hypothetical protein
MLAVVSLFVIPRVARAQVDWQPISPEDLAMKDNPKSPGADAMILYRESAVDALKSSNNEYVRIKIFTQEGTKEGNVEIPFVKGTDEIRDIRARTIQPDGSITIFEGKPFEKTVVKAGGYKELAETFTLPDVKPGCIIEYKYNDQSNPTLLYDYSWTVQEDLFTRFASFSIKPTPGAPQLMFRKFHLPTDAALNRQSNDYYTLEIHDLPGIEEEEFMPPERSLRARVAFYYRDRNAHDKETTEQYWERIGKAWNQNLDDYVNKKGALESDLSRTINTNDPPEVKLRKIYARVQQIRNLSMEEEKTQKEEKHENLKANHNVEDVLKHGYGYGGEINYLFVGLARAAGFEATEVFVVPRNFDLFVPSAQDSSQLDANIAWVRVGAQEYYLDPAASFFPFGLLPWHESAVGGLRFNKKGSDLINTPLTPSSDSTVSTHADLEVDEEGNVTGQLQVDFTGQRAAISREENHDEDETGRKKAIEDEIKERLPGGSTFEITKIENWENNAAPIHVEGTLKVPGFGTSAGRRLLVPLAVLQASEAKAFQPEKRYNDLYFHYPFEEIDDIKLKAPEGYKVESVPPEVKPINAVITYEISAAQQGDTVEVKRHLVLYGIMFDKKYYPAFRAFFSMVKSNDDAQIVLQSGGSAKKN